MRTSLWIVGFTIVSGSAPALAGGAAPSLTPPADGIWRPSITNDPKRLHSDRRVALAVGNWLSVIGGADFAVAMAGVGLLIADANTTSPSSPGVATGCGFCVEGIALTVGGGVAWLFTTISAMTMYDLAGDRNERLRLLPRATANGVRWVF